MVGFDELKLGGVEELSLAHPDPVVLELNRLQNQLKGFSLLHSSCFYDYFVFELSKFQVCAYSAYDNNFYFTLFQRRIGSLRMLRVKSRH